MKFLLSTCFSIIFFQSSFSQDITLLDSFHYYEYLDNNWELIYGREYDQVADGTVISTSFDVDVTGARITDFRSITTFNDRGDIEESIAESYVPISSSFSVSSRLLYTYDDNHNLLTRVAQLWDDGLNDWVNSEKYEYSLYDSYNNYALFQRFNYSQSNGWIENSNTRIENFYENDLLDSCYKVRNGEPFYHSAIEYNSDGLITEDRTVFYFLGEADFFTRTIPEYNDQGLRSYRYAENYSAFLGETEYVPSFQQNYSYSTSGQLLEQISEAYDEEMEEFYFNWKRNYYYPQSVSVVDVSEATFDVRWNNSMIGQVEIAVSDLDVSADYHLSIFDNSGRLVKNLKLENRGQWSTRYRLNSGMYHLVIYDDQGNGYSEKIMVQ